AFLLVGHAVDDKPRQHCQHKGEELQPKVVKDEIAQKVNHLPIPVDGLATVAGGWALASSTGPGFVRSLKRKLAQKLDRVAGVTKTEVKTARSSSEVIPRTNWPL